MKNLTLQKFGLSAGLLLSCCIPAMAQDAPMVRTYEFKGKGSDGHHFEWNGHNTPRNPCKVFIGVTTSSADGGVQVLNIIHDTPADRSELRTGDVIVALDGVPVSSQRALEVERDKHQPGDAFVLTILRDGAEMKIQAAFKSCSDEEMAQYRQEQELRMAEMQERVQEMRARAEAMAAAMADRFGQDFTKTERAIIGIYPDEHAAEQGIRIGQVVQRKGAEAAGVQAGDVITHVDGKTMHSISDLRTALDTHKPGDEVAVVYQRDGQTVKTTIVLSADRTYFSHTVRRDPCAVFIGVYTAGRGPEGQGVRISGIVEGTPAQKSGIQPGDVVLSMDGVVVNSHDELLVERNKHKPGEAFRLLVLREGTQLNIEAAFNACPIPDETPAAPVAEEVVEMAVEEAPVAQPENTPLSMEAEQVAESLSAFPNPTAGMLNVQFEGESAPTTVRITDVNGKVVYNNNLRTFDGYFNEQISLSGNAPGTYILRIEQNGKVMTKKILLLPRA